MIAAFQFPDVKNRQFHLRLFLFTKPRVCSNADRDWLDEKTIGLITWFKTELSNVQCSKHRIYCSNTVVTRVSQCAIRQSIAHAKRSSQSFESSDYA